MHPMRHGLKSHIPLDLENCVHKISAGVHVVIVLLDNSDLSHCILEERVVDLGRKVWGIVPPMMVVVVVCSVGWSFVVVLV